MGVVQTRNQGIGAIGMVSPVGALRLPPRFPALLMLVLIALAGCAMDRERAVRAQLSNWVILRDTVFFRSTLNCTGGVFAVSSDTIKNRIKKVNSIDRGLRFIARDMDVAFKVNGQTPEQVHQALDKADRFAGLVILVSALAAKDCYGEELSAEFFQVLNAKDAVLMYGPQNRAMALFDRAGDRIFYARGRI